MKAQFALMPDAFFAPFVDMINSAMSTGIPGMKAMTKEDYRAQVAGVLNLMSEVYQQSLPGALLSGAALTGVLSVTWGNWLRARRGLATDESYIGPTWRWFLPRNVTLGLTLMWVVAYHTGPDRDTPRARPSTTPCTAWRRWPSSYRRWGRWTASSSGAARPTAGAGRCSYSP